MRGCATFWEVVFIGHRLFGPLGSNGCQPLWFALFALFWACSGKAMHMWGTKMNQKFGLLQEMIASKDRPSRSQCVLQGQGWNERGLTRQGMLKGSCERALAAGLCTARQLGPT